MLEPFFDAPLEQLEHALLVAIAAALSGLIGWERETFRKPAGFRTHMLVGGASALLVLLGEIMGDHFLAKDGLGEVLRIDPLRLMQAIVVGVSFIGAGTILKVEADQRVRYLTTAASVLFSAGIGIAVALGQAILAAAITLLVFVINYLLGLVSENISEK